MTPPSVLNCTFRGRSFHQCGGRAPIGQPIGRGNGLGDILPGKRSSDGDHAPIATIAGIIMPGLRQEMHRAFSGSRVRSP